MRDAEIAAFVAGNDAGSRPARGDPAKARRPCGLEPAGRSRQNPFAAGGAPAGGPEVGIRSRPLARDDGDIRVELLDRLPAALQESEVERVPDRLAPPRGAGGGEGRASGRSGRATACLPRGLVIKVDPHVLAQLHGERDVGDP